MDDAETQFIKAIERLDEVADALTPEDAHAAFDAATLQSFWRDWTRVSGWAGSLWRLLNQELGEPATPAGEPGGPEIGGSG